MGWLPLFLSLRPLFFDSPLYSQPLSTFSFSSENSDHLRTVYIYIISTVLIAMSFTPLPSFGSTLPAARNTTVARDLSLPFRRDVDTWQAFSAPLNFKNPQNTRAQANFCYANDASNMFSDVDVETQSFSSVKEIPPRQSYVQKIVDAILWMVSSISSFGRRII